MKLSVHVLPVQVGAADRVARLMPIGLIRPVDVAHRRPPPPRGCGAGDEALVRRSARPGRRGRSWVTALCKEFAQ